MEKTDIVKTKLFYLIIGLISSGGTLFGQSMHTPIPMKSTPAPFGYYEYLPDQYLKSASQFPLIIYLHGVDEKGNGVDQLSKVLEAGLASTIKQGKNFDFVILSPQSVNGFFNPEALSSFITYATETYRVDKNKVYLTGISSGAISIWNYVSVYQDQVAAIVPIAGNGYRAVASACKIKDIPVWAFHGEQDTDVKPGGTVGIITAINNCKPKPKVAAKYTLYPKTGHNSWTKTYNGSGGYNIYEWMLSHSKKGAVKPKQGRALPEISFVSANTMPVVCSLPAAISNNSGISTIAGSKNFWAVNKTTGENYLYQIDTLGKVVATKKITSAANTSWSDITKDASGNVYIADAGNAKGTRRQLQIYKVIDPANAKDERLVAETINVTLPDQVDFPPAPENMNFDIEAITYARDSLFLFTKNRTEPFDGVIKMYRIPATKGSYTATLAGTLYLGDTNPLQYQVNSVAVSPDGKTTALLTNNLIWLISNNQGNLLKGKITQVVLPVFSEKLAIDFIDDKNVILSDLSFRNLVGGKLYRLNLAKWMQ